MGLFLYLCKHEILPQPSELSSNLHRCVSALFEAHGSFSILFIICVFYVLGEGGWFLVFSSLRGAHGFGSVVLDLKTW